MIFNYGNNNGTTALYQVYGKQIYQNKICNLTGNSYTIPLIKYINDISSNLSNLLVIRIQSNGKTYLVQYSGQNPVYATYISNGYTVNQLIALGVKSINDTSLPEGVKIVDETLNLTAHIPAQTDPEYISKNRSDFALVAVNGKDIKLIQYWNGINIYYWDISNYEIVDQFNYLGIGVTDWNVTTMPASCQHMGSFGFSNVSTTGTTYTMDQNYIGPNTTQFTVMQISGAPNGASHPDGSVFLIQRRGDNGFPVYASYVGTPAIESSLIAFGIGKQYVSVTPAGVNFEGSVNLNSGGYTTDINYITEHPSEFEIIQISGAPKDMTCNPNNPDNSEALCPVDGTVYLIQYKNNNPYYITWFNSWNVVNRVQKAGVVLKYPSSLPPNLQYIKGYVAL